MKEIQLSNGGGTALVDSADFPRVSKHRWFLKKVNPYAHYVATSKKANGSVLTVYLHRFITNCPPDMQTHHRNNNFRDNQQANLEICTKQKNLSYRNPG